MKVADSDNVAGVVAETVEDTSGMVVERRKGGVGLVQIRFEQTMTQQTNTCQADAAATLRTAFSGTRLMPIGQSIAAPQIPALLRTKQHLNNSIPPVTGK